MLERHKVISNNEPYLYKYFPLNGVEKIERDEDSDKNSMNLFVPENFSGNPMQLDFPDLYKLNFLLSEKKIWFSKCEILNDPLEFFFWIHKDFYDKFLKKNGEEDQLLWFGELVPVFLSQMMRYYGMSCWSANPKNFLMWSYYASGHSGVCVRFKLQESYQSIIKNKDSGNDSTINITKYDLGGGEGPALIFQGAKYEEQPCTLTQGLFEHYESWHIKHKDIFEKQNITPNPSVHDLLLMSEIVPRKSKCWTHEDEYRLITLGLENGIPINKITNPDNNRPFMEIDAVIFGLKTNEKIKKIIKNTCGSSVDYLYTDIVPGTYEIEIKKE